ncbi:MAG: glycosyltransferase, partial [Melioribacteraceae bacterium]
GQGDQEEKLKELWGKSRWKTDISFRPFLPFDQLFNEIKNAKYFSMSSIWYENAPMVILEAFDAGLIPLVPDFGGMKETVEQVLRFGRTYKSNDLKSWKEEINYLEKNYADEYARLERSRGIIEKLGTENYLKRISHEYSKLKGRN